MRKIVWQYASSDLIHEEGGRWSITRRRGVYQLWDREGPFVHLGSLRGCQRWAEMVEEKEAREDEQRAIQEEQWAIRRNRMIYDKGRF